MSSDEPAISELENLHHAELECLWMMELECLRMMELECLRMMLATGGLLAAPAGLFYCAKYELPAPSWLICAAAAVACQGFSARDGEIKASPRQILADYKKDRIDYARWSMVDEILEQRALLQQELRQLSCLKGQRARKHLEERQALLQWLGTNLETAFECASEQLTGTDAAGSDSTIKRSYQLVEQRLRNPAQDDEIPFAGPRIRANHCR